VTRRALTAARIKRRFWATLGRMALTGFVYATYLFVFSPEIPSCACF
jgi:hypothetical protein